MGLHGVGFAAAAAVDADHGRRWRRRVIGGVGSVGWDGRLWLGLAGRKTRGRDGCLGRRRRKLGGLGMGRWDEGIAVRALEAVSLRGGDGCAWSGEASRLAARENS